MQRWPASLKNHKAQRGHLCLGGWFHSSRVEAPRMCHGPSEPIAGLLYLKGFSVEGWLRSWTEEVVGRKTGEGKLRQGTANHTPPSFSQGVQSP